MQADWQFLAKIKNGKIDLSEFQKNDDKRYKEECIDYEKKYGKGKKPLRLSRPYDEGNIVLVRLNWSGEKNKIE